MSGKIKSKYDAVVVGSGIGGLLSAAFLAKKGYSTCVLERLSFYGGKFAGFNYKGFQVPTGAFHMVPGGEYGGLGRSFKALNLDISYTYPDMPLVVMEGGKRYRIHRSARKMIRPGSYVWQFSWREIVSFLFIVYYIAKPEIELPDVTFGDFLKFFTKSGRIKDIFDKFMIFANGATADNSSLQEFKESVKAAHYHPEAAINGGCVHLMNELVGCIESHGGELFNKSRVARIVAEGNRVSGVELEDGSLVKAKLVVSNAGPGRTQKLLGKSAPGWFREKVRTFTSSIGISYSVASDEPLLDHDGVEVPLDHEYICGYIQISNLDPTLAPPGKHYLLAAQMPAEADNLDVKAAVRGGIQDLLQIFPQITRENIINISTFQKEWPGAATGQRMGQSGYNRYPIKVDPFENLYMVSHDSQGWGFAGDIIGHAALNFNEMI